MNFKLIGAGIAALSLLATSFSAQAADIPRPFYKAPRAVVAYYNWTGFYAGINGGYGWGDSDRSTLPALIVQAEGWLIGGTLGYNYQVGSFVCGLEGDWDWSDVKGAAACGAFTCETSQRLARHLPRPRSAMRSTAGCRTSPAVVAYGQVKATSNAPRLRVGLRRPARLDRSAAASNTPSSATGPPSSNISTSISAGSTAPRPAAARPRTTSTSSEHIVRAGLNYKFSGPIFSRF